MLWKEIPFNQNYQVSDDGQVRKVNDDGVCLYVYKGFISINGYVSVNIPFENKYKTWRVHNLVMMTFVGPRPNNFDINHIDGNKKNNNLLNLEYVTRSENFRHAYKIGLKSMKGENHTQAKLTNYDINEIVQLYKSGISRNEIARDKNVSISTINGILSGRKWSHITGGRITRNINKKRNHGLRKRIPIIVENNDELWLSIKNFNAYEISNYGRVRRNGKILNGKLSLTGYPAVVLRSNGKGFYKEIHRLVAEHFLNFVEGMIVHHKDNNRLNSHVSNLEFVTRSQNAKYSWQNRRN